MYFHVVDVAMATTEMPASQPSRHRSGRPRRKISDGKPPPFPTPYFRFMITDF